MDRLGINLGFLLFQIFNFTIIALVLYALAYKPIVKMLEERKKKIAQGYEDAQVAAEARANAEKEAEKVLAEAQAQAAFRDVYWQDPWHRVCSYHFQEDQIRK